MVGVFYFAKKVSESMADGKIIIDTKVDSSGAEKDAKGLSSKIGNVAGKALGGVTKVTAAMVTAAAGAVTVLTKLSIEQYAQYEQLVGGVETLFKDSSKQVLEYANNAYKTAGMSANEYMSTITGFSASLLQGLGGDTKKAAEIGNKAVTDMSDNANKMGTSMEMIQNAYQGFAKQNYTMLDNLKLGYGGTKTEMQRLLADAEKLSGIKYNINNFSDIIEAIHVIQDEMGITGTTAKEASETIEGSLNMTKAAWTNLMTGMADENADFDKLIDNFIESASAFGKNILPRIKIALGGVGKLISRMASELPGIITSLLPQIVQSGIDVVKSLIESIRTAIPDLIETAVEVFRSFVDGMSTMLPQMLQVGADILYHLMAGIAEVLPELVPLAIEVLLNLIDTMLDNITDIIDMGIYILESLVTGILNALPILIERAPEIIDKLIQVWTDNLPRIIQTGLQLIGQLTVGIIKAIPDLVKAIPKIIQSILDGFKTYYSNMADIGRQLIEGIWEGITNAGGWLKDKIGGFAGGVVDNVKGFFGIHSPSRIMRDLIGTNLVKGIGVGIDIETPNLEKDIDSNMLDLVAKMKGTVDYETAKTTARVVAENNRSLGNSQDDIETKDTNNNGNVVAVFDLDGRRFMRAIAQYQDEFEIYNERRLT